MVSRLEAGTLGDFFWILTMASTVQQISRSIATYSTSGANLVKGSVSLWRMLRAFTWIDHNKCQQYI